MRVASHPERSGGRPSTSLRFAQDAPAAQSKDVHANSLIVVDAITP